MFWHVSLHVKSQVVRSRETSLADFAFERFGARVLSIVASQLIRPENDQFDNGACWERERERERETAPEIAAQFLQKNVRNLTA